jgi:hypothetical protein
VLISALSFELMEKAEAWEGSREFTGLLTVLGFLAAFVFSQPGG